MSSDFLIWSRQYTEGFCRMYAPEGVGKPFDISFGRPVLARWPRDVSCRMDPDFPKDIALSDSLYHKGPGAPLISGRLYAFLREAGQANVEFLPVTLINHKGRVAADDYGYYHPVGTIDCVDLNASGAVFEDGEEDFDSCQRLVLDASAVPADIQVFRPRYQPRLVLLRRALGQAMQDAGFTGLWLREPDSYTGLF